MNLFRLISTSSLSNKWFGFVIINDYSQFTWVLFLAHKNEAFEAFAKLFKKIINEKDCNILKIRSDHGAKFENQAFNEFYFENSIDHNSQPLGHLSKME